MERNWEEVGLDRARLCSVCRYFVGYKQNRLTRTSQPNRQNLSKIASERGTFGKRLRSRWPFLVVVSPRDNPLCMGKETTMI